MSDDIQVCPPSEQLKALLDRTLSDAEQAELQAHVDGCTSCQKTLEELVAGGESWEAAAERLRETTPSSEPVLSEAMRRMKADESADASAFQPPDFSKSLDFLEPSDQHGSLGKLGEYEVSEVVGWGGMGVVLKAFDPTLHRVVAVKVLAPYLAHNPQARKRFVREAQAIAAVSHDHVITIHAIDGTAEHPKIVMQYVAGRSLQQKLDAEGSLDLKEILRIGMQTASGLAAAHAQGLVHRDVKPSNILLENGIERVRLTDFGLARAVDDASVTQSGVIAGTPQYMAPEQARGDAVDHRADLFSLGSVMYAMCVGHSPFRASTTMGVLKRVCDDPPRPIRELNPDIPDWLCAIVNKLLAKKPGDRLQTAKEVAEVLEQWLAHVQQPSVVPKPPRVAMSPVSIPSRLTDNIVAKSILFQPISGRWLLFFLLAGIAVTMAVNLRSGARLGEALMVSLMAGLGVAFWGLFFVAVVRFIWSNLYGVIPWLAKPRVAEGSEQSPGDSAEANAAARPRSRWLIPPESTAMLAAIITLMLGGYVLFAAVVAIVVWRLMVAFDRKSKPLAGSRSADEMAHDGVDTLPKSAGSYPTAAEKP